VEFIKKGFSVPFNIACGRCGMCKEGDTGLAVRGAPASGPRSAPSGKPILRSRPQRVREAKRRLDDDRATEREANEHSAAYRKRVVM
jgi:hypothetical protein